LARAWGHLGLVHLYQIPFRSARGWVRQTRREEPSEPRALASGAPPLPDGRGSEVPGARSLLTINDVPLDDTFAEAFPMTACRLLVTAATPEWARTAGLPATGDAPSVIACDAEAGIERELPPDGTPGGRPGVSLQFSGFSRDA